MRSSALFVFLLQGVSCALAFVSRTNIQNDDVFQLVGRFAQTPENTFQATWSYSGVRFNIESQNITTNVLVNFGSCTGDCEYFVEAQVDCADVQKFEINAASPSLVLALNTEVGQSYEIQFRKLTESSNGNAKGVIEFQTISLEGAEFLPHKRASFLRGAPNASNKPTNHNCLRRHKMLVVGDSITAAYGVDGAVPCDFSAATENEAHSYASIVATEVAADLHVVAWSGKGVVRNYGDVNQLSTEPMPTYYNRTLATQPFATDASGPNYWAPSNFPADIVLVMLGTNDYSTQPQPSDEQFVTGLVTFLQRILSDYPQAKGHIAAMCAPMQTGPQCTNIQTAALQAGVEYVFIDPDTQEGGSGCAGHPNAATQQNMAAIVAPRVKAMLRE